MDPIFLSWLVFVTWVQEKGGCKSLGDPGVCPDAEPRHGGCKQAVKEGCTAKISASQGS